MVKNNAFGFDPTTVFGDVRKETRNGKKSRKKKDCLECMQEDSMTDGFGLGIDTFSLADPNIDALGIGSGFGDTIGQKAGLSNGGDGGFLGIVGGQQLSVPSVTGKGRIARGSSRKAKRRTPLQKHTGTKFGDVDKKFAGNVIGNVRGIKEKTDRLRHIRIGRNKSENGREDPKQLTFNQQSQRPQPALTSQAPELPDKRSEQQGSSEIQKFRDDPNRSAV